MPNTQLEHAEEHAERVPNGTGSPRFRRRLRAVRRLSFVSPVRTELTASEIPETIGTEASAKRDALYRRSLAVADMVAAALALVMALAVLGEDKLNPLALAAFALAAVGVGKIGGLYERDEHIIRKTTLDEAPDLFRMATLFTLVVFLGGPMIAEGAFGRNQAVGLWGVLFVSMLAMRAGARMVVRHLVAEERCLVLGDAEAGHWLASKLEGAHGLKAKIVGRTPLQPDPPGVNGLPIYGDFESLGLVLAQHDVDRVIIAPGESEAEHILDAVRRVKALGVKVSVLPRLFEVVGSSVEFDDIDGAVLLGVRRYGLSRSSKTVKRALDLFGASLGLLLIAPVLAVIALAIKLDTRGPVFFRQRRMGRVNTPFDMLKFRTMVEGADAQKAGLHARNEAGGGLFKIQDDPRITRVGRFLRRMSLDELPQLFNVLRGDMALVGPRPLVIDEDARIDGWQRRRLLLTPGMTGLWQVFGSARIPMNEMVKIDYLYGANWSLWLDIKILLRTVPFVLGRRGL